ncbi:putative inactive shikimate kinase like 2, chloroplastic [Ananas comosus]|uniref:Putative inactive shikimate kinase like 2, chloroplastic n=1 Tax=Ananas comosus TaxID=4615 RepID=A0A199W4B1_ANACO|nr:putative inactive shikimate kinase like 2, chloroplastic [Ananas comosus]
MAASLLSALSFSLQNPRETLKVPRPQIPLLGSPLLLRARKALTLPSLLPSRHLSSSERLRSVPNARVSSTPTATRNYEFADGVAEVELRLDIGALGVQSSRDVFVDVDETSLLIRVKVAGTLITLMETDRLFERIKSSETIWYIDEDQLVLNLKKYDADLKWPDIKESWESLSVGIPQLLKGTSVYIIGDSTEINEAVAKELANGIGYVPLYTSELLERYAQQSVDSWVASEGADSVAAAESAVLESLSSHVRTVVATLGGQHGAASRPDRWRHLHAGFTVWLSRSEAIGKAIFFTFPFCSIQRQIVATVSLRIDHFDCTDEASAKEEAQRHIEDGSLAYTKADVVVKLGGWDIGYARDVAQGCLSALKQLTLSDKQLAGKKSLYIRLGCRGDWPNIKPPGWDPSSG